MLGALGFDLSRVKTVTGADFQVVLENHLNGLQEIDIQGLQSLKHTLVDFSNTQLGKTKLRYLDWVPENTHNLVKP